MSEQEKIIQTGKEIALSKVEFCKNMYVVQMVGTIFLFTVSSLTRTRGTYLMQVLKYSVLIVTFFAEVWIGENKQGDFSAADSGYRLPSPKVA